MRYATCLVMGTLGFAIGWTATGQAPSTRLRLMHDTLLAGVPCAATGRAYAVLHPNGALDECPLAVDRVMAGHALPRGTWIRLRPDGVLDGAWLPRDTDLQGLPCKGTGYKGWAVRFHPDGALALCYLARAFTIDGVPCKAGAFLTELTGTTQVALYPSGRLRSCRLAQAMVIDGVRAKRGQRVTRPAG